MSSKPAGSWHDRDSFLACLHAKNRDGGIDQAGLEILDWAAEHGLRAEPQERARERYTGYVVRVPVGDSECALFKLTAAGDLQFYTDAELFPNWFQQQPPFDAEAARVEFHRLMRPVVDLAFPLGGSMKEDFRLALRSVACLPGLAGQEQAGKPKIPLRWLTRKDARDRFLQVFEWVAQQIRDENAPGRADRQAPDA
jgi:hypothetical protein